jgi:hypothetical protein
VAFNDDGPGARGVRGSHLLKGMFNRRIFLLFTAPLLAVALGLTLVPRSASHAAVLNSAAVDNVEWIPGDAQNIQDASGCYSQQNATINTSSPTVASMIAGVIEADKEHDVNANGIKTIIVWNTTVNGSSVNLVIDGWYNDGCSGPIASSKGTSVAKGTAVSAVDHRTAGGMHNILPASVIPTWAKGAVGAIAGAAVYVGVSILVAATIAYFFPAIAAGTASAAALAAAAAVAGCIGGATSTAVTLVVAGASSGWQANLSNAVAGCATGAAIALLPIAAFGQKVATTLRTALSRGAVDAGGTALSTAGTEAGVQLGPISQVITTAESRLATS